MAVLKDIEVTIQVNGQALQESHDDDEVEKEKLHRSSSQSESSDESQDETTNESSGESDSSSEDDGDGEGDQKSKDGGKRVGEHCLAHEGRGGGLLKENLTSTISKYIEATSNACFAIKIRVPKSAESISDALSVEFRLDGVYVDKRIIEKRRDRTKDGDIEHCFSGAISQTKKGAFLRPFMFKAIECVDSIDPSAQKSKEANFAADLGTIVIKVWRIDKVWPKEKKSILGYQGELLDTAEMDEKALKGRSITHSASFGKKQKYAAFDVMTADCIDKNVPYATFKFKYCSKAALQARLLIPRTPSPHRSPTPTPWEQRPVDELTPHQTQELARRHQAMYQAGRGAGVKAESAPRLQTGTAPKTRGKRARDAEYDRLVATARVKKAKMRPFARGEVVDLSD